MALFCSALYHLDLNYFFKSFSEKRILSALWLSISAASIATVLALIFSIPTGYALSRYNFFLKPVADVLLELPVLISPAALGALLLIFLQTPPGLIIREYLVEIVYTFGGIILAQFISVLGICTRMIKSTFDEITPRYENIARTLGATPVQCFFRVSLPLAKNGIFYAGLLTWAKAIGEFGATITLAGSIPMKTETLPTAIYMKLSTADVKGVVVLIVLLLTMSLTILIAARFTVKKNHD